jgi:hypothetical protein
MDAPEIDTTQEMNVEDFVSAFFPGFDLEEVVMPRTGERIQYANGKEQAEPSGSGGIQADGYAVDAAPPGEGDGHQGR